jgi:hypothetical protein
VTLWRIQDGEGRGPFKPGFSHKWIDTRRTGVAAELPPIYEALGVAPGELWRLIPERMHAGCACRSAEELAIWFSRSERRRLWRYGYRIVVFEPDLVLAEPPHQVVFAQFRPLSNLSPRDSPSGKTLSFT